MHVIAHPSTCISSSDLAGVMMMVLLSANNCSYYDTDFLPASERMHEMAFNASFLHLIL